MKSKSPDKREYTADEIALYNADPTIDPGDYNGSVQEAANRNTEGWQSAMENLKEALLILKLIECEELVPIRVEDVMEEVYYPPSLPVYPGCSGGYRRGQTVTRSTGRKRFIFDYETACLYSPSMSQIQNPLSTDKTNTTERSDRESDKIKILLGCMVREFLTGSKYHEKGKTGAKAEFFTGITRKYLKNSRGFGKSLMNDLVKEVDDLMAENKK